MANAETGQGSPTPEKIPGWILFLAAVTAIRFGLALAVPLLAQETYHWNFARHLDWSYHDHPPMIAWAIAVGRIIFGDTRLGVRFVPLLFSVGTSILVARLAQRIYGGRAATSAVLLLSIQPVTFLASKQPEVETCTPLPPSGA